MPSREADGAGPFRPHLVEAAATAAAAARAEALRGARREEGRARGVVATPARLARAMMARLDRVVRRRLARPGGLADPGVALVDPCVGTGTFLAAAFAVASARAASGRPGAVLGWDVDADALAAAERALGPAFALAGWPLALTVHNPLLAPEPAAALPPGLVPLVVGNPPWSGRTANRGPSDAWLDDFRRDAAGAPLGERKVGVLSDDYVRFVRLAAELARASEGGGAVCLVTNASYLDGPVHRGMRAALLRWFDGVDVVDLGGSALVARAGRDANLFGVRPGAAILLAWRAGAASPPARAPGGGGALRVAQLRGGAEAKLAALERGPTLSRGDGRPPACLFVPRRRAAADAGYGRWPALPDLMPFHREGLQTNRDAVATDVDRGRLLARLHALAEGEVDPAALGLTPRPHFDPLAALRALRAALEAGAGDVVRAVAYRPGERRFVCVVPPLCHRPRPDLLAAFGAPGGALVTVRKDRGERPWAHVGWVVDPPDSSFLSARSSCRTRAVPLRGPDGGANLAAEACARWGGRVDVVAAGPRALAWYALAVLWSPAFRARFDGALRLGPPRLPPPPDAARFERAVALGARLAAACERATPAADGEGAVVGHRRWALPGLRHDREDADDLVCQLTDGKLELTGSGAADTF